MAEYDATEVMAPYVAAERSEMVRVALTGLIAGVVVPLIDSLLANWLFKPFLCAGDQTSGICTDGGIVTAFHTALILVGVAAITIFASWGVYRPLPLLVGVTVALWPYRSEISAANGTEYVLIFMLVSTLTYGLLYWIMRLRSFILSMVLGALATWLIYWTLTTA